MQMSDTQSFMLRLPQVLRLGRPALQSMIKGVACLSVNDMELLPSNKILAQSWGNFLALSTYTILTSLFSPFPNCQSKQTQLLPT